MSDANSLPETLDGANVQLTARTRQDNWPTSTTYGEFSSQHRVLLDKVDTIQATIDFIRITGYVILRSDTEDSCRITYLVDVLRIDTIRSSGPASLKVTWILASSFPVSFNEAGPEDLIVSIRNR